MSLLRSTTLVALVSTIYALPQAPPYQYGNTTCEAQPVGAGPIPTPDTPEVFVAYKPFSEAACDAPVPEGYVQSFSDLHSASSAKDYIGYITLDSYDPKACALACSKSYECSSFNIFFERDPTVDPAASCTNPPSTTTIKCSLWGGPVLPRNAVNTGQYRQDFHVVIAGSNGYINEKAAGLPGYNSLYYGNGAINAPLRDCEGINTYIGQKTYDLPYDPALCSAACDDQRTYNIAHPPANGTALLCNFFNIYVLSKNGVPKTQVCSMYTRAWPTPFATNYGQYQGHDHYTISWSLGFENASVPCNACLPGMKPGQTWGGGEKYQGDGMEWVH